MLVLEHIFKTYYVGDEVVHALYDASLHVRPQEFVAICGPSGSGKTTLMNVMGCLDLPDSGRYILDGVDIAECSDKELSLIRSEKIGFVFQQFNLLDSMSALENVELPLIYQKCSQKERIERAKAALDKVGLYNRKQHRPSQLSGGQQQRVAIARAIVTDPLLLLADEPTGNLDTETGTRIHEMLAHLNRTRGITLVVVTHNQSLAERMSRCIGLRDGRIVKGK